MDVESDPLVQEAKKAIDKVFGDTSCTRDETLEKLEYLQSEIQPMIDDLSNDDGA